MPGDILTGFVDWTIADPRRVWFICGWLVGAFMMFSILTGKWIILDRLIERVKRRW